MTTDATLAKFRDKLIEATRTIEQLRAKVQRAEGREPVAVVGMGLRMPGGATSPEEFWRVLADGVDTTGEFPSARGDARALFDPDPDNPGTAYVIRGGFLDGPVDEFDPAVFGISPREAVGMDPQQRMALEVAWEALERAGYAPDGLAETRTGVFVGLSTTDYVRMRQQAGDIRDVDAYQLVGEPSFLAGRISYTLGLRGPAWVVDTSCSSSIVALHEACQALRHGECDMALAGGVNLMLSPYGFVLMSKFRALAPDGRCKTFDASADGYARGEGACLFVLKRLSDAVADRDTILAVVRGSAVNHDGPSSGLTVPNPAAQQDVIRQALEQGRISPREVGYVEAHGTGTSLGDPIELRALDAVMGDRPTPLLVGSVKTNVGHLEPAAGVAGLLKIILAMRNKEIPPHLHLTNPNPKIPWRRLRIEVPTSPRPWPDDSPLGAVSSFGASGTNAHIIVGPADAVESRAQAPESDQPELLLLSARSTDALREVAARYVDYLGGGERLADVCFTSQVGRARHGQGLALASGSSEEMAGALADYVRGKSKAAISEVTLAPHKLRKSGWLFTGQGSQYAGMAQGLREEPEFASAFAECREALDPLLPTPLESVLWGPAEDSPINDTRFTQSAIFAVEYSLGRLLLSWGLTPAAMLGHSIGEITAACLAGVMSLPDAARLVAERARLMSQLPPGGVMLSVSGDEETVRRAIEPYAATVSIAAVNGADDIVVSGAADDVAAVRESLDGHRTNQLKVSHAFHSPLMEPMLDEFRSVAAGITYSEPQIPLISNVTGKFWTGADAEYWVRHVRGAVRFADGMQELHDHGVRTFVEVGPHPVLTALGRKAISDDACAWIHLLRRKQPDRRELLRGIGGLYLRGASIDWQAVNAGRDVRRVPGPVYPWQRERFWFRPADSAPVAAGRAIPGLGHRVRTGEPVFEERLDEGERATEAAGNLAWLVERAVRAASAGHGGTWRRLSDVAAQPVAVHEAAGAWLLQWSASASGEDVVVTGRGSSPEADAAGEPWQDLGAVTVCRAGGSPGPADVSGDRVPVADEPGLTDEASIWGRIIAVASRVVAGDAWARALDEAWCEDPHAVRELAVRQAGEDMADATLLDAGGNAVGELRGLRYGPLPAEPAARWRPEDELLYSFTWQPGPFTEAPRARGERVLLAGEGEFAARLAEELGERGAECDVADPGAEVGADVTRIVFTAGLTAPAADETTPASLRDRLLPLEQAYVELVQRLAARENPPRITLLTRGAMPATGDVTSPAAGTLWGLGRVVNLEHPPLWGGAVDLDPAGDDDVAAIASAVLSTGDEDQQALRGRARYVARLRPMPPGALPSAGQPAPRPGTVLITGGFGGIGLSLAGLLARSGAERIVLASRGGLPAEESWDDPDLDTRARERIDAVRGLRRLGARVEAAGVDVTDPGQLADLVQRLAADDVPLRGVINAAGVSGPQFIEDIDVESYRKVWEPKTVGTWALHELTRDLDLDYFVCFSSIASTWGSQHLASYAAGNAFLDGLTYYRASRGLPCLTVNWGPWGLASELFDEEVMAFLEAVGLRQLHAPQCLSLLERMMRTSEPQYIVCGVDWETYKPVMEARAEQPLLRDIEAGTGGDAGERDEALLGRLAETDDRVSVLVDYLASVVAEVLRTATEVAPDDDIFRMGMDSLMIMEIVAQCRRGLGISFPPSAFFGRSTLGEWAAFLDELLREGTVADDASVGRAEEIDDSPDYLSAAEITSRVSLADEIRPSGSLSGRHRDPSSVLLTGATGFVGAYLLDELLEQTSAQVVCLVRAGNKTEGMARIRDNYEKYLPWRRGARKRIRVVLGDLAQPRLGLREYDELASSVDAIYHNGAWVDFLHPFDRVAPANIGGTEELFRMACTGQQAPVHYVSTYGIWGLPEPGRSRILETEDISTAGRLITGYVQTKWGAEQLCRLAVEQGIPVDVHRPGRVLGDSRTGAALTTHFTIRVIKGCIQLGLAPDLDFEIEMTPVDYVARALVRISLSKEGFGDIYHLVNPVRIHFRDLVEFIRGQGWQVEMTDRHDWWASLEKSLYVESNELHPVMETVHELVIGGEEAIDYDVSCTERALQSTDISCPPLDENLLRTYFDYFVDSGYLSTAAV